MDLITHASIIGFGLVAALSLLAGTYLTVRGL